MPGISGEPNRLKVSGCQARGRERDAYKGGRVGRQTRSFRVSDDHTYAQESGDSDQSLARREDLAGIRTEATSQAAEAVQALATRWQLHPTAAGASQSCVGVMVLWRQDVGWA